MMDYGFGYLVKFLLVCGILSVILFSLASIILTQWRYFAINTLWLLGEIGYGADFRLEFPQSVWLVATKEPYLEITYKNETKNK